MSIQITTEQVKKLRDSTGISVMQCRKALEEADGDKEKALAILKKNSSEIAQKKLDREVKDGRIAVKMEGNKAVLVALLCETDFVARNEDFVNLLNKLTDLAFEKMSAQGGPASGWKGTAKELIDPVIQKTGENIQLGDTYEVSGTVLENYVHNGKIGVIVSLRGGDKALAKDIAMHVAAMKPEYLATNEITEETKATMREIFEKETANSDKPEEIKKKMLEGKMATYFKERTLSDQPFIKDSSLTVATLLARAGAEIVEIKRSLV